SIKLKLLLRQTYNRAILKVVGFSIVKLFLDRTFWSSRDLWNKKMDRNVPTWDAYFMTLARVISTRSKDPNTKVGAVLTTSDNRIIGTGYNGMPEGMIETDELWQRP